MITRLVFQVSKRESRELTRDRLQRALEKIEATQVEVETLPVFDKASDEEVAQISEWIA